MAIDRALAEQLSTKLKDVERTFGEISVLLDTHDDEAQRRRMMEGMFRAVWDLFEGITREILAEHPDLDPDYPGGRPKRPAVG